MPKTPTLDDVAKRYQVSMTPLVRSLAKSSPAVARQFVPDTREMIDDDDDALDPIGDRAHSPVPGIVHRYPDRALLMPLSICPVYCRFCFRRETVGQQDAGLLSEDELDAAFDYLTNTPSIWEVILSGGDPLALSPRRLQSLLQRLRRIPHIRVLRIHTRVPLLAPERINEKLTTALRDAKPVFVVLHTNHADEFTDAGRAACARLVDTGTPLLSQSVLLKGVNDAVEHLEALMRVCVENRIKPYYLHHSDKAPGTSHLRTTLQHGRELVEALRGPVSGLCQPHYVLDIPGGHGKVPMNPDHAELLDGDHWWVRDTHGHRHRYRG
ncbi:MAG: lysine-2,3-aminomutase-like protein [Pseudomonadota bacterium]